MPKNEENEQFEVKRVCECWLKNEWCFCEGQPELE